ncbi:hypothetical protein ACKP2L_05260 [Oenococcus alcoholitolerans]|uniref:Uncharacterized protein n=1 Tax=Oenococcus alcoholitolerans TaxID=931074 RepID=A0ABR4XP23_9LACO|nr:hypothetical protein Q757_08820 [Oenococcus alcoholitolerans]
MDKNTTINYGQVVNDDNDIMIAEFSATDNNGLHDINLAINSIDLYKANKDKIITEFDNFLQELQPDSPSGSASSSSSQSVLNSNSN